jgi:hypothetical protein
MFFRFKTTGQSRGVQIVENGRVDSAVRRISEPFEIERTINGTPPTARVAGQKRPCRSADKRSLSYRARPRFWTRRPARPRKRFARELFRHLARGLIDRFTVTVAHK